MGVEEWVAIIGAIGGLVGSVAQAIERKKRRKKEAELEEVKVQVSRPRHKKALEIAFTDFFSRQASVVDEIHELIEETEVDRVIFFRAVNGVGKPVETTAYFQQRADNKRWYNYEKYPLDDDYRDRLKEVFREGLVHFLTAEMPEEDCEVGDIYRLEKVVASYWGEIISLDGPEGMAIYQYFSIATHSEDGFSPDTDTRIKIIQSKLKSLAETFYSPKELTQRFG